MSTLTIHFNDEVPQKYVDMIACLLAATFAQDDITAVMIVEQQEPGTDNGEQAQ